eukprot:1158148-Pelagomonas_calceolata.AAC.9
MSCSTFVLPICMEASGHSKLANLKFSDVSGVTLIVNALEYYAGTPRSILFYAIIPQPLLVHWTARTAKGQMNWKASCAHPAIQGGSFVEG